MMRGSGHKHIQNCVGNTFVGDQIDDGNSKYISVSNTDDDECANDDYSEEDICDEKEMLITKTTDNAVGSSWDATDSVSRSEHEAIGDQRIKGNRAVDINMTADHDPDSDLMKSNEIPLNNLLTDDEPEIEDDCLKTSSDSTEDMVKLSPHSEPVQLDAVIGEEEISSVCLLSNPFGDDDTDGNDTPPKSTEHDVESSNPFGDDDDEEEIPAMKEDVKRIAKKTPPPSIKKPFNPFDDGEIEAVGGVAVEKILHRRREVTESLAPVTVASMYNSRATSPSLSQFEVPSKKYSKEYQELMNLGFDRVCVGNALQKSSGDAAIATKMLKSRLFDDRVLSNDQLYVWKSPLMLRVGEIILLV